MISKLALSFYVRAARLAANFFVGAQLEQLEFKSCFHELDVSLPPKRPLEDSAKRLSERCSRSPRNLDAANEGIESARKPFADEAFSRGCEAFSRRQNRRRGARTVDALHTGSTRPRPLSRTHALLARLDPPATAFADASPSTAQTGSLGGSSPCDDATEAATTTRAIAAARLLDLLGEPGEAVPDATAPTSRRVHRPVESGHRRARRHRGARSRRPRRGRAAPRPAPTRPPFDVTAAHFLFFLIAANSKRRP